MGIAFNLKRKEWLWNLGEKGLDASQELLQCFRTEIMNATIDSRSLKLMQADNLENSSSPSPYQKTSR